MMSQSNKAANSVKMRAQEMGDKLTMLGHGWGRK